MLPRHLHIVLMVVSAVIAFAVFSYAWGWSPEYPQLSLKHMSLQEATKIYVARLMKDGSADWKVAMNFYGKVVDENNQPVAGANVHYEWNTVGIPGGTAHADSSSDRAGLFSLTNQHGKVLGVTVSKEGYYPVENGNGRMFFEYANPSSPVWYEPDQKNPAIFHLRKWGVGATLFNKSLDFSVRRNHLVRVNLIQGFIKPDRNLTIAADFSHLLPGAQPFPWTASISMAEGGLVETKEQFPFMAPASGYVSSINFSMTNLDRSVWKGGVTKLYYFYLPSTNTYGLMKLLISSAYPIGVDYEYNITPGDRVLEPANHIWPPAGNYEWFMPLD